VPPAVVALGREADGRWRLAEEDLWNADVVPGQLPPGFLAEIAAFRLAVPGEVEVRHRREAVEPTRWERSRLVHDRVGGERRTIVVDLHAEDRIVRLVEGITDLRGLPGHVAGSARQSLKNLVDALGTLWPGIHVDPRRPCLPAAPAPVGAPSRMESGWPAWEEHTRMTRVHRWGPAT
jgi:hypothetical protein